jgi:hypothetical protein
VFYATQLKPRHNFLSASGEFRRLYPVLTL